MKMRLVAVPSIRITAAPSQLCLDRPAKPAFSGSVDLPRPARDCGAIQMGWHGGSTVMEPNAGRALHFHLSDLVLLPPSRRTRCCSA